MFVMHDADISLKMRCPKSLASYAGFSYEVLCMYNVEKGSAVLENVASFARLDEYIYIPVPNGGIGVCLYIGETNFPFPQTLYELECHQR